MQLSASLRDIKSYQEKLEKGQIIPDNLPVCIVCNLDSNTFKLHSYRSRIFYIITKLIVKPITSALARFQCPGCGKTYTWYPDFALPFKRYTRQTIAYTSSAYVLDDANTYKQAIMVDNSVPGYRGGEKTMAASSVHRWVTTCGNYNNIIRSAQDLILQKSPHSNLCRDIAQIYIAKRKYRNHRRKTILEQCAKLLKIEMFFETIFQASIFTKFAINCGFS